MPNLIVLLKCEEKEIERRLVMRGDRVDKATLLFLLRAQERLFTEGQNFFSDKCLILDNSNDSFEKNLQIVRQRINLTTGLGL